MPTPASILVVDDESTVRDAFRLALTGAGYRVLESADGLEALEQLKTHVVHLMILDVDMPKLDGWKTLAHTRRLGFAQPVLMITHANDVDSRIKGLDSGADDYLGKPCSAPELLARVRALLRRANHPEGARAVRFGNLHIDLAQHTATRAGSAVRLSRTDYAVLTLLHEHAGQPVPRELMLQRVWDGASGSSHALDTHIWRLRRKLGDDPATPRWLCNVPGIGYVLHPET